MNIIFYSKKMNETQKKIANILTDQKLVSQLEIVRDLNIFIGQLLKASNNISLALLILNSKDELKILISNKDVLSDIPLFIILNKKEDKMLVLARKLFPRFLCDLNENINDLSSVLAKMIQKIAKDHKLIKEVIY